jgi:hypothetical protein
MQNKVFFLPDAKKYVNNVTLQRFIRHIIEINNRLKL